MILQTGKLRLLKMANEQLTTKKPSPTDLIEQNSKQIFESKLPLAKRIFTWYGDKYPNLDGHIEFVGENGSTAVKMFFQLKSSEQDIAYHDCEKSFLNYCYQAAEPTFLVFTNIPQQKVYWEHITISYIEDVLGIKNLTAFEQQTKRINFSEDKIINSNTQILIEECRKHYQDKSKIRAEIQDNLSADQKQIKLISEETKEKTVTYHSLRERFASMLGNMTDKLMLYYALVYMLKPFYLDQRGERKRRALLGLLQITDSQERFLIESLVNANLLGRVGDLIFITRKEEAVSVINHYIDAGQLNLAEITQLFSQDENQGR